MGKLKQYIKRYKWILVSLGFIFGTLPQWIDSVWDLAEKIKGQTIAMPHLSLVVTIPIGLLVLGIVVWAVKSGSAEDELEQILRNILTKMHKRTLELKDKARIQYMVLFRVNDFIQVTNQIADTYMNSPEKKEELKTLEKHYKGKRLRKDSIKQQVQIDGVYADIQPLIENDWTLDKGIQFSNLLDGIPHRQNVRYEGIKALRSNDGRWNRLFIDLNKLKVEKEPILADKHLAKMIRDYMDSSYVLSSVCLFTDIVDLFRIPMPSAYISSGANNMRVEAENYMTKSMQDIINRVNALAKLRQAEKAKR
ncbi:MAG: hypothetical protein Q7R34_07905 [Dehalococcoidia bacterium]|nr:hypothetical protein [Dehalococcoidia bacterium]